MLYSSGTTGRPKGVKWALPDQTGRQLIMLIELLSGLFGYGSGTRYPLSGAALPRRPPSPHHGDDQDRRFSGGDAEVRRRGCARADRGGADHAQPVGATMFVRLLKLPEETRQRYSLASMTMAVHAAAPCPVDVKRA